MQHQFDRFRRTVTQSCAVRMGNSLRYTFFFGNLNIIKRKPLKKIEVDHIIPAVMKKAAEKCIVFRASEFSRQFFKMYAYFFQIRCKNAFPNVCGNDVDLIF